MLKKVICMSLVFANLNGSEVAPLVKQKTPEFRESGSDSDKSRIDEPVTLWDGRSESWSRTQVVSFSKGNDLALYKQQLNLKLNELEGALSDEGYRLDEVASESPRARIANFASTLQQVKEVEMVIAQNRAEAHKAKEWPGEERAIIGGVVASGHECRDLLVQLGNNNFARSVFGVSILVYAVNRYLQRK